MGRRGQTQDPSRRKSWGRGTGKRPGSSGGARGGGAVPKTRRGAGIAMNAKTEFGKQIETEDLLVGVHNKEAGGGYHATGEYTEVNATNGDKGS